LETTGFDFDDALNRICVLVYFLDIEETPAPEAAGLEALIGGMRQRWAVDDVLLAGVEKIFDTFYQAFSGKDS
jgi:hypothetical protein